MGQLFRKTFAIHQGEELRALLMLAYIFLVISSLLIIKPVGNALFLSQFGVAQLPAAFILVAVFAALITILYSRLARKLPLNILVIRSLYTFIICLAVFRVLFYIRPLESLALYLFYIWVAIFALIATSQFWVLANLVFNAREARRLFGFIGSGGIAGGIFGGYLTNFLAPLIGTANLLFVCIFFLYLCIPITQTVWRHSLEGGSDFQTPQELSAHPLLYPFKLLRKSPLLTLLAGLVGISVLTAKVVDYEFSAVAAAHIADQDKLAAFFGFWLSNLNIVSLLIQLFVTRRVVGVFGVGTSLFFLPVGILLGAFAILAFPALWAAVLLKVSDGSLKQSINRSGMELLALPVPAEIKNQAKTFIDVFIDSFATGVGGILLSIFAVGLGFSVRQVSLIIIVLVVAWLYLVVQIRREYLRSFRRKIGREKEPPAPSAAGLAGESVLGGLIQALEKGEERQVLPALRMVKEIHNPVFIPSFKKLITHPSRAVRLEVLENIYFYKNGDFLAEVRALVNDPDQEIKTRAIEYLFRHSPGDPIGLAKQYLANEDYRVRGAALLAIARESRKNQALKEIFRIRELIEESIRQISRAQDEAQAEFTKITCARAIGAVNEPALYPHLHAFFGAASPAVLKAAIVGAAQTGQREFIPELLRCLGNPTVWHYARQALSSFGLNLIDMLASYLENPETEPAIRRNIPRVLASMGVQKSVEVLLRHLDQPNSDIRDAVLKGLTRLRVKFPHLKFDESRVSRQIGAECENYLENLAMQQALAAPEAPVQQSGQPQEGTESRQKLEKTLGRQLEQNLERIFRLLILLYPSEDIYSAYLGIQKTGAPEVQASALEFLENLLEPGLKRTLIPILETVIRETTPADLLKRFDIRVPSRLEIYPTR